MTRRTACAAALLLLCSGIMAADPLASGAAIDWTRVSAPAGWKLSGDFPYYTPDNLFERINGECEAYFPYGFRRMTVLTFTAEANANELIEAQAYEMGSPLDAYGICSQHRTEKHESGSLGCETLAGSTMVMFYQDRFFVKLRYNQPRENKQVLLCVATAISPLLPPCDAPPQEPRILRMPRVNGRTIKYTAPHLDGLEFMPPGVEARATLGDGDTRVFAAFCGSDDQAAQTLKQYQAHLTASGLRSTTPRGELRRITFTASGGAGGAIVGQEGRFLFGVTEVPGPVEGAVSLFEKLRRQIRDYAAETAASATSEISRQAAEPATP
ncbi:MAG: hypothetical protein KA184_12755 [Candidatus Hydrogenedentes bacterium]|nr:hypothetical protein [Candidatus Hydrogenedentota bacterium]